MHHLSWIRQDICSKIDNWSSRKYFDNAVGLRERILDRYDNYKEVAVYTYGENPAYKNAPYVFFYTVGL